MREPDTLDYLFVAAITGLAYLQLPWRPEIRTFLRRNARQASALARDNLASSEVVVAALVVFGAIFILFVSQVLPRLEGAE